MSQHFIVYDIATGVYLRGGQCPDGDLALQVKDRPGEAVMEAPVGVALLAEVNLAPVKESLKAQIDADAETYCLNFVTPGTTQSMRYEQKLAEAKAWAPGADINQFAMLKAETVARNMTAAALVAEILGKAAAWLAIGAAVEGARMAAKAAVDAAPNIAAMHQASQVDWAAVAPAA